MSRLRPELITGDTTTPSVDGLTAYLLILRAVEGQRGLIHGHLHQHGESCAIGSFFNLHGGKLGLPTSLVDEVAAVNDAAPYLSSPARKRHMLEWLRWKLGTLGWTARPARAKTPVIDQTVMETIAQQVDDLAREHKPS